jgi:hypothetical protein
MPRRGRPGKAQLRTSGGRQIADYTAILSRTGSRRHFPGSTGRAQASLDAKRFFGDLAGYSEVKLANPANVSTSIVSRFILRVGYASYEKSPAQPRRTGCSRHRRRVHR